MCSIKVSFPTICKIARVTPIYKSRVKDDLKNYRPISILTYFSKIIEKNLHAGQSNFFKSMGYFTKTDTNSKVTFPQRMQG